MLLPGQVYSIYNSRDVAGTLPHALDLIVGRAARWVGVSEDYLCAVVWRYEKRLARRCKEEGRRKGKEANSHAEDANARINSRTTA
jgi:RNA polymerase I-specific transcription initiation factor RRN7